MAVSYAGRSYGHHSRCRHVSEFPTAIMLVDVRPSSMALPVALLLDSGQSYGGRPYRDCLASAHRHHVPIVIARRGMRWSSGDGVTLDLLAPSLPFLAYTGDDVNENSIVAMLHYQGFRELFMGDAGEASEERLLQAVDDLHAKVIKVGHHGSAYASIASFASHVRSAFAVISVGRHNAVRTSSTHNDQHMATHWNAGFQNRYVRCHYYRLRRTPA